ncbi:MAG TPA: hypothetical protein VFN21_09035 [Acidimicrobiales bacterium]|nr:hypothetical protein [Acidimicrobiales bacterium]
MGDFRPPPFDRAGGGATAPQRTNVLPWVIAALALVVVAGVVVFTLTSGSKTHSLTGTVALVAPGDISGENASCKGTNEFAEFGPGMEVTVTDGDGAVIGEGTTTNQSSDDASDEAAGVRCVVDFQVDVDDAAQYQIDVGEMATQSFDRSDLEADDWHIVLNLG